MQRIFGILALVGLVLLPSAAAKAEDKAPVWPKDAQDVAAAIYQRMLGTFHGKAVTFAQGGLDLIEGGKSGGFAGFTKGGIGFLHYENDAKGKNYNAEVLGVINVSDKYARTAALRFFAKYAVAAGRIEIKKSMAVTASPPQLGLQILLVPAELLNAKANTVYQDWSTLYEFASANAFKPDQKPEYREWQVLSFVMAKLPPDAGFEAIVSKKRNAIRADQNDAKKSEVILDYDGWRVHVFNAKFKPGVERNRFYINYFYRPGEDMPKEYRDRRHIAQYDTKR